MRRAGYCVKCAANVWLAAEDDGCPTHGPSAITTRWEVDSQGRPSEPLRAARSGPSATPFIAVALGLSIPAIASIYASSQPLGPDAQLNNAIFCGLLPGLMIGITTAWVAKDAHQRGLPGGWAAGVLLLWIIFFPLCLIVRSGKTPIVGTKVCPHCAERIQEAATKCRFCGSELDL